MTRAWPHVRATLVTFHLVAIVLAAVPAPEGGMDRNAWREPSAQAEFARWARWFGSSEPVFEDRLWSLANGYMDTRAHVLRPIVPYLDLTGAQQPWRLFVAPDRFPARLAIDVHHRETPWSDWTTVFEERSSRARWNARLFESERVRTAIFRYAWPGFGDDAQRFCRWIAVRRFAEARDEDALRCRSVRARSPSPAEVRAGRIAPPGAPVVIQVFRRDVGDTP